MDTPKQTKKKQVLWALGAVSLLIGLLMLGMWINDPNRGQPTPMELAEMRKNEFTQNFTGKPSASVSPREVWIATSERRIADLVDENKKLTRRLENLEQALKKSQEDDKRPAPAPIGEAQSELALPFTASAQLPPPPTPTISPVEEASPEPTPPKVDLASAIIPPLPPSTKDSAAQRGPSIQVISLGGGEQEDKRRNISHYLPVGSFARAVLLSGVDAPTGGTAKSNPLPVVLRLKDPGQLPNYFNSDIEDCGLTAAAYGDIASERVQMRVEMISCVLKGGRVVEEKVSGWIAGEDGKIGVRGRLVERTGTMLAKSFVAGSLSGLASVFASQYQQVSTSPLGTISSIDSNKAGQHGLASGFQNSLDRLANYYMDRLNEVFPVIEVDAGRIVEVVFNAGTDFKEDIIGQMGKGE